MRQSSLFYLRGDAILEDGIESANNSFFFGLCQHDYYDNDNDKQGF